MLRNVGVLTGLLVSIALPASMADDAAIDKHRAQIAAMSESDRIRLSRNLEQYRGMSAVERADIGRLHAESSGNPKAAKLIDDYGRWLSRLAPFDRERLARAADPVERAKLVQSILEEQRKSRSERDRREDVALFGAPVLASARRLGVPELDAMIGSLERGYLADDLKQRPLPENLAGRERHLQVLERAMDRTKRDRRAAPGNDDPLIDAAIDALPDMAWKSRLKENKKPRERRLALGTAIAFAVREEWQADLDAATPTEEQVSRFIANRGGPSGERAERMKTPEGRRMMALRLAGDKNPTLRRVGHVVFWLQNGFREPRFFPRAAAERRLEPAARKTADPPAQPPAKPSPPPSKPSSGGF